MNTKTAKRSGEPQPGGAPRGTTRKTKQKVKVLIAKPGLDGHDVGAKVVVRGLMEAGFEVVYTGLRKTPEEIAAIARDEAVDVIGLSVMSGSHLPFCRQLRELLTTHGLADRLWLVGGNIPQRDIGALEQLGVDRVFPVGSSIESIADFIHERIA